MIRTFKYITMVCISIALTSCGGSSKIKNLVDFTPKLQSEIANYQITIPQTQATRGWYASTDWVNNQPRNITLDTSIDKFVKKHSFKKLISAPILVDGKIVVLSSNGSVTAFDSTSYKELWHSKLNTDSDVSEFQGGGLFVNNGTLFVTYGSRDLVSLDIVDGKELWRKQFPDVTRAQPVVYNNLVFVLTISNQLCAVDTNTGGTLWQHEGLPETLSYGHNFAPVIFGQNILVGYSSGQLSVINIASGQEIWQLNVAKDFDSLAGFTPLNLETQPIIDNGMAYITSANGLLLKLDLTTGQIRWKRNVQDIQTMNKSGNALFVTTNGRQVAALSDDTGEIVWATDLIDQSKYKKKASTKPVQYLTPVVLNNELVVITASGKLYSLAPDNGVINREFDIGTNAQYYTISDKLRLFTKTHVLESK